MHWLIVRFFRWYFNGRIEYIKRMAINNVLYDADIRRLDNSYDWWLGRAQGLEDCLVLLDLKDIEGPVM